MVRTLLLAVAAALGVATGASAQDNKPVRIGFSISKTGLFAQAAGDQIKAYDLWLETVNARGGIDVGGTKRKVEFVSYDDQSNPANAVRIYEKLITDDKVDLLTAPWGTPFHIAIAPVLERFQFPMVGSTAASVALREIKPGNIWFPTSAIPDRIGAELTAMMKANNVQTAAVIANVLPFAKEIKSFLVPALQKEGIRVVVNEEYPPDIKDMTAMLSAVKRANPDAILALSYPGDSVLYAKQAKELDLRAPFQFVAVGPGMDFFGKVVGSAADGFVTLGHWDPYRPEWTKAKPFNDAYIKKFNERPDYLDSALGYMTMEILEQAVAKAGLDRAKLRQTISTETFDTVNGPVKFQGVQNAVTPTAFIQVQGNEVHLVWPASIATAKYRQKTQW
jgi:branched-chain amino acid transport system substrate-binding protein